MTTLAAELRATLRLRHMPVDAAALRGAARVLAADWDAMRVLIDTERLGPLLYRALGRRDLLEPVIEEALRMDHRVYALRNRLLLRELAACLRVFAAARIDLIVLKGAAVAEPLYGDVALRPMVDVDLLIRGRDRATARTLLEGLGYTIDRLETRLGALANESEANFRKSGAPHAQVDLHWSLFDSPHYQRRIDMDWFWRTAQPATIAGEPAWVLGPEAQVLHLCGHLMLHHSGGGLLWRNDVVEVLRAEASRLDWHDLLARARRYDLQLPLRSVLIELAEQWSAPIPLDVLAALRGVQPSPDEAWLFERLGRPRPSAVRRFWVDIASMPGWADRWRFAAATLFPSPDYMRKRYAIAHPLTLPLYYPYRWLKGVRGVWPVAGSLPPSAGEGQDGGQAPVASDDAPILTFPPDGGKGPGTRGAARPIETADDAQAVSDALVTCMYNGLWGTSYGGRLNRDGMYRDSLLTIAKAGVPIICFVPADDVAGYATQFADCRPQIAFEPLELHEVPHHAEVQRIKAEHAERYADLPWQERCVEIMWGKFFMLERALQLAPRAAHVYWIDAGLANANIISTKYITESDLAASRLSEVAAAFPPKLFARIREVAGDRLLVLKMPNGHHPGIPAKYNARPYERSDSLVAGLFGGPRQRVAELCALFREKAEAILHDQELYFEESILTGIYADHAELFWTFTFDTWFHEGWQYYDPQLVNFSNFFDVMLETPAPDRIVKFPWNPQADAADDARSPSPDHVPGASQPEHAGSDAGGSESRICLVTSVVDDEPLKWGLEVGRIAVPMVMLCSPDMAEAMRAAGPSPAVRIVARDSARPPSARDKLAHLYAVCRAADDQTDRYYWLDIELLYRNLSFEFVYSDLLQRALHRFHDRPAYFAMPGYEVSSFFGGAPDALRAACEPCDGDVRNLFEPAFSVDNTAPVFRAAFSIAHVRDLNLELAAAIEHPILHVIGDSHVLNCFTPSRAIGCRPNVLVRTGDVSAIPIPYTHQFSHHLGSRTMHHGGQSGALLNAADQCGVKHGDAVVWVFGEIDVRCHIIRQHRQEGRQLDEVIDLLTRDYVRGILEVRSRYERSRHVVFAPIPPLDNPNYTSADLPVFGSIAERVAVTRQVRHALAALCARHGLVYLEAPATFETPQGDLQWDLSDHF